MNKRPTIMEVIILIVAIMTYIQVAFVPPLDPVCPTPSEALCTTDSDCEEKFPGTTVEDDSTVFHIKA